MSLPPFRIVFVSQEADRPAAVAAAVTESPPPETAPIHIDGFATAELAARRDTVIAALSAADAIVVSHVLVDEVAIRVANLLDAAVRPDAQVLVLNSLWPVMQRTRLGSLRFGAGDAHGKPDLGPFARFLPIDGDDLTTAFRALIDRGPELLRQLPPTLVDVRFFLQAYLYWSNPAPVNLRALAFRFADTYGAQRGAWCDLYGDPEIWPKLGLYHPACGITEDASDLPEHSARRGTIGLLLMRGPLVAGATRTADAVISRLEAAEFRVVAAFAESFDFREAIGRYHDPAEACAIVSLTGFPLVGGHNRCAPDEVAAFLSERNIPYVATTALMTQDVHAWERSPLGLTPMELAMQTSIHELEGGIEPVVAHALAGGPADAVKDVIPDRVDRLVSRLGRWRDLQTTPNADKRVLLTLFSFPPGKGSVGTAAYLDVFRSAWNILERLRDEGYSVDLPESPDALLHAVVEGDDPYAPITSAGLAVGERVDLATYERIAPDHRRIERMWGPAPGSLNSDGRHLIVHGIRLGNVFVGVQPSFGFEGDPMRLLFDRGATPHHGFLAYYRWATEIFGAHAVIHLGTHGALEFMPGKQAGLSSACWPDILAGELPNLYLYSVNNPSEGTIAKRRGHAVTIGHLTPPADHAGLYSDLLTVRDLVSDYLRDDDPERRRTVVASLRDLVLQVHLDTDLPPPLGEDEIGRWVRDLGVACKEIETRRIPVGLHTIGRQPEAAERTEVLAALASAHETEGLAALFLTAHGHDPGEIERDAQRRNAEAVHALADAEHAARDVIEQYVADGADAAHAHARRQLPDAGVRGVLDSVAEADQRLQSGDELTTLVRALAGGYVAPGPGGDPARHPGVLPVGRNLHALDPAAVPSEVARRRAEAAVALLLDRHRRVHGSPPRHLGLVLWGLDNIKTHGEGIAQALCLLGVRAARNSIGRVTRVESVSIAELGRPRVDVTITASGIFRDIFGLQMDLLDRAVRLVAGLDESDQDNPIRARARRLRDRGFSDEESSARVFSNAPGAYGTHIDYLVSMSRWEERTDLAASFVRRKGFRFGGGADGERSCELLGALAEDIDATVQNLDSSDVSLTDVDHYFEYLGGLTAVVEQRAGSRPEALVIDGTSGRQRLRDAAETIRLETRARLLNPKWYEGLLKHGYEGVEEIRKRVEYTFGWSATCDAVDGWVYEEVFATYVDDPRVRDRMRSANVHAYDGLLGRLREAANRGFWSPDEGTRQRLDTLHDAVEDAIEGVAL